MVALSCPVVVDIVHQPFEISLALGEKESQYTPDFKVTFKDGDHVIVEVKPEVFLEQHAERLRAAEAQLKADGKRFLVVTDKHIDANGLSARAILLMRYGRLQLSDAEAMECQRLLKDRFDGNAQIKTLMDQGMSEATIWNLVAKHNLRVPAGLSISPSETVSINEIQGGCHDFFRAWVGLTPR